MCSINYGVTFANEAYILDVLYTKEPMEITELATAKMLHQGKVNKARIESNNGGRSFARNVRRILEQEFGSNLTVIKWFSQSKNQGCKNLFQLLLDNGACLLSGGLEKPLAGIL